MAKSSSRMLYGGQDDKLFSSRLLYREKYNSSKQVAGEASFRVLYYGGAAGSVPFMWESQPGTPKNKFSDNPLPPLTPPPSYQSASPPVHPSLLKKHSKSTSKLILNSIFPSSKKISSSSFSPSSSSSSSSLYSLPSTPSRGQKGMFKAGSRSTVHFGLDEEEYEVGTANSPTSTLCFGTPRISGSSSPRRFRGYSYPIKSVKKVMLSIVGHGAGN